MHSSSGIIEGADKRCVAKQQNKTGNVILVMVRSVGGCITANSGSVVVVYSEVIIPSWMSARLRGNGGKRGQGGMALN